MEVNPLLQGILKILHSDTSGSSIVLESPKGVRRLSEVSIRENILKTTQDDENLVRLGR